MQIQSGPQHFVLYNEVFSGSVGKACGQHPMDPGSSPGMFFLPRARKRKEVKQFVLSVCLFVCQFVSQSGGKFLNLNIDRVKRFPNLTVALTL